jgi:Abnormal spindle-like microcephaly-assoc'd, ASPM-SPD-2-Hydin
MKKYFSVVVWGVLLLAACGGSPTATLSVRGSPTVAISVPSISFGDQFIGTVSAGHVITLSNTGSAELHIVGIATTLPFTQTNTCTSSLPAGATCTINVTFAPDIESDFTNDVSITSDAKGSPQGSNAQRNWCCSAVHLYSSGGSLRSWFARLLLCPFPSSFIL